MMMIIITDRQVQNKNILGMRKIRWFSKDINSLLLNAVLHHNNKMDINNFA